MRIPDPLATEWRAALAEYEQAMRDPPRQETPYRALTARQLEACRRLSLAAIKAMRGAVE